MNSKQQNSSNTVFPRDIVFLKNISINTLHKGDDDDDNDDNNNNNNDSPKSVLPSHFLIKCCDVVKNKDYFPTR